MFLKQLHLKGLLSFRDTKLELRDLNVLIGPNGSGKSNLIEVIGLLQALPRDFAAAIRHGGGVQEWLWRGRKAAEKAAQVFVVAEHRVGDIILHHTLTFASHEQEFTITEEMLEAENPHYPIFQVREREGVIAQLPDPDSAFPAERRIDLGEVERGQSVLSAIREPRQFPQMAHLAKQYESIRIYRDLGLGPSMAGKQHQTSDRPSSFLEEDTGNLNLILNRMELDGSREKVEEHLTRFYEEFEGLSIQPEALSLRLFMREKGLGGLTPANRLSDGTIRYLCLLAILCHPEPPPLICIEEPEIGLHPDILHDVAHLLLDASQRTQLIVTTHSDILIDALSGDPETVVVCERDFDAGTTFRRLTAEELKPWLEDYTLGKLWRKGQLGGVRW